MAVNRTSRIDEIIDPTTGFVKGTNRYIGGHQDLQTFKRMPIGTIYKGGAFKGRRQRKAKVSQNIQILDESLENFKHPNSNLDVAQKIANTAETVPIIFGKRTNNIGGVWMQPSLIKAGTDFFNQKLIYVISQGDISSSPDKAKAYAGLKKLIFLEDQSITVNHLYSTAATLATTPNSCPISGTGLYCGNNIYSYLSEILKTSGSSLSRSPDRAVEFFDRRTLTRGSGDTSNTTFVMSLQVFDAETGANVTTAYQSYLGFGNMQFRFNGRYDSSFNLIGGKTVGTIESAAQTLGIGTTLIAPVTGSTLTSLQGVSNGRTKFIFKHTFVSLDTQTNASNPASTGTLEGVQQETIIGTSATIQNTSNDNSSFADITFLATTGNLYEQPSSGTFPSSTKQLYIFYEQGVKVDLFSAGLTGSSYTVGASNQFIDLAMYLFKIYKKIDGNNTAAIVAPVELSNLQNLSSFCTNNSMFFNGIISKAVNIIEFISSVAPFYLLSFLSVGGKYQFAPILPINSSNQIDTTALTPVATFTEANILPNTFRKIYLNVEDRRDIVVNCIYTDCIPTEVARRKTVSVRFSSSALDSPTEQYDLSEFCTDLNHSILYAKYELARRKHSTHDIAFSTPLLTTSLIPTDIIKLEIQRKNSVGDDRTETNYYQVTSITYDNNGISSIQASHFPLDSNDIAEISKEITTGTFTVLQ